jgi:hypothetical protein
MTYIRVFNRLIRLDWPFVIELVGFVAAMSGIIFVETQVLPRVFATTPTPLITLILLDFVLLTFAICFWFSIQLRDQMELLAN